MKKVIDVHAHVGDSAALYVSGGVEAVTSRMQAHGITHSVISPIPGFEDPEGVETSKKINKQVADIRNKHNDIFPVALGVAEPRHGKMAVKEVSYILGDLSLDGLMFHNDFEGVEIHSTVMIDILDEAIKYGDPLVLIHTAQHSMLEPPFALGILAKRFPDLTFLCGHPMMSMMQLDNMVDIARRCPNIYFDTCAIWTHNSQIERAIEMLDGSERLLFGTDNPYFNVDLCIDKEIIEQADISEEHKANIFYKNFERIIMRVED